MYARKIIHAVTELGAVPEASRVPGKMLAHFANAHRFSEQLYHFIQVAKNERGPFFQRGRGWLDAGFQEHFCLTKEPGVSLARPADHDAVAAGLLLHSFRVLGRTDVPVPYHRDAHGILYFFDHAPVRAAGEALALGASVHRDSGDPDGFRRLRLLHGRDTPRIPPPPQPDRP